MTKYRTDSVALVLAGSRGLGLASARALAGRGFPVAVCARNRHDVESAEKELADHGPALGVVGDVSDPQQLRSVMDRVRSDLGPIRVLVANSGGPAPGGFEQVTSSDWEAAYRSTLMSFVEAVTAVLPDMRSLGSGRIVLIGSSSIRRPLPGLVLSNTFRTGLNGLVKDLTIALAPDEITVNMVAPGRIDTERVRQLDARAAKQQNRTVEQVREASEASIPMGRYGTPAEFGALVGFLASDEARYITGQSILVDGGLIASSP